MSVKKLNIGMISFAHPHAPRYAQVFYNNPLTNLYAISGDGANTEMAKSFAEKYNAKFYKDYTTLLKDENIDAVYIAIETYRHKEVAIKTSEYKKHILLEKPIALTIKDAEQIIESANKNNIKLMVPFNPRFAPPLIKAKEIILQKKIGKIRYISAVSEYVKPPMFLKGFDTKWFIEKEKSGGGGFMDTAPHGIDSILWLLDKKPKKVFASIGSKIYDLQVDDIGTVIMEFEDETVAILRAGWGNPKGYPFGLEMEYHIMGDEGFLHIDSPFTYISVSQDSYAKIYTERPDVSNIVSAFAKAVLENKNPPITGKDALINLKIVLAAYKSSETKEPVELSL